MTAYDKQLDSLRVLNSDRSLTKQMIKCFRVLKKNRANCGNPSVRFLKEIHHLGVSLSHRRPKGILPFQLEQPKSSGRCVKNGSIYIRCNDPFVPQFQRLLRLGKPRGWE